MCHLRTAPRQQHVNIAVCGLCQSRRLLFICHLAGMDVACLWFVRPRCWLTQPRCPGSQHRAAPTVAKRIDPAGSTVAGTGAGAWCTLLVYHCLLLSPVVLHDGYCAAPGGLYRSPGCVAFNRVWINCRCTACEGYHQTAEAPCAAHAVRLVEPAAPCVPARDIVAVESALATVVVQSVAVMLLVAYAAFKRATHEQANWLYACVGAAL